MKTIATFVIASSLVGASGVALAEDLVSQDTQSVFASPSDPEASFLLAQQAAQRGDFRTAISALERVLILFPGLDNVRLELGILYLRTGSTELGQKFIRDALRSPDAPPEVRARAAEILAASEAAADPVQFSGNLSFGIIADTNANSGPAVGTTVGGSVVTDESSGQSDVSAFASLSGSLRYDLGFQAGHQLALDASLYSRGYADQTNLNLSQISIAPGIDFNLGETLGRPSALILRGNASRLWRDGEEYLEEYGATAALRFSLDETSQAQISAFTFDQDFLPTTAVPTNDNRDGRRSGLGFEFAKRLENNASLSFSLGATNKTAAVGFEAYDEVSFGLTYGRVVETNLFDGRDLSLRLRGAAAQREYDAPDPIIDPTQAQEDTVLSLSVSMSMPLNDRANLLAELGHTDQSSNYPLDDYDNSYLLLGISLGF